MRKYYFIMDRKTVKNLQICCNLIFHMHFVMSSGNKNVKLTINYNHSLTTDSIENTCKKRKKERKRVNEENFSNK